MMEATNPQGSFGIPNKMRKQLEEHAGAKATQSNRPVPASEVEANPSAQPEAPEAPEAVPQKTAEDAVQEDFLRLKKQYSEALGIEITDDDVRSVIFKGRLTKDVTIIPGFLKGALRTLNPIEHEAIDEKIHEYAKDGKHSREWIDNQKSLYTLSYVWLSADGSSLGKDPEERYKNIRKMDSDVINDVAAAWRTFDLLIKFAKQEKKLLKKL